MEYTYSDIAKMIDHSLLNPVMTDKDMEEGCKIAVEYDVASVCIKPYAVALGRGILSGTSVEVGTTIGFPHGGHSTAVKVEESIIAMDEGATELDMVCNIGRVLQGDWNYVRDDIGAVVQAGHAGGAIIKVIFENCYLEDSHKIELCKICESVKADFVKTSTGYGTGGATIEDLKLMRANTGPAVQVKAAGGVRDLDKLLEARAIGVTRVGATATIKILEEVKRRLGQN